MKEQENNFTFEEIDILIQKRYLSKDKENTFGISYISLPGGDSFRHSSIRKQSKGYKWSYTEII